MTITTQDRINNNCFVARYLTWVMYLCLVAVPISIGLNYYFILTNYQSNVSTLVFLFISGCAYIARKLTMHRIKELEHEQSG